jgi:hypothetical protein
MLMRLDYVSELQLPMGIFLILHTSMKSHGGMILKEEIQITSEENLSHCYFVHNKSHMD